MDDVRERPKQKETKGRIDHAEGRDELDIIPAEKNLPRSEKPVLCDTSGTSTAIAMGLCLWLRGDAHSPGGLQRHHFLQ